MKGSIVYAKTFKKIVGKADKLGISRRSSCTEKLCAELIKLAVSSCLRSFVTEAIYYIKELKRHSITRKSIFDDRSCHASRSLGTECVACPVSVGKGVHFLLHYISSVTDSSLEKLSLLEGGEADLAKTVFTANVSCNFFNKLPFFGFFWEDIHSSSWFLYHF